MLAAVVVMMSNCAVDEDEQSELVASAELAWASEGIDIAGPGGGGGTNISVSV